VRVGVGGTIHAVGGRPGVRSSRMGSGGKSRGSKRHGGGRRGQSSSHGRPVGPGFGCSITKSWTSVWWVLGSGIGSCQREADEVQNGH
jgi:hypothetical protein